MRDLSHLLIYCSKEFQRFDILPFYPMRIAGKILISSGDSFKSGKISKAIDLHEGKKGCAVLKSRSFKVSNYYYPLRKLGLLVEVQELGLTEVHTANCLIKYLMFMEITYIIYLNNLLLVFTRGLNG